MYAQFTLKKKTVIWGKKLSRKSVAKGSQRFCSVGLASSKKQVKGKQFQHMFFVVSNFDCIIYKRTKDCKKKESGFGVLHHLSYSMSIQLQVVF